MIISTNNYYGQHISHVQFYVAQLAGCFTRDGSSEIPATEGRSSRPRGTLSLAVPSQAMAAANCDVHEATSKKKRGLIRGTASAFVLK